MSTAIVDPLVSRDLGDLRVFLEGHLKNEVMPFWFKHGLADGGAGGINSCIGDDGKVLSQDKYLWSQLRSIYTFSAMYNHIEKDGKYLSVALKVGEFVKRFGRDEQGRWVFAVKGNGELMTGHTTVYNDGFAIMGFTELFNATGDERHLAVALETYRNVRPRLDLGKGILAAPYVVPAGMKAHAVSMIFSLAFHELAKAAASAGAREAEGIAADAMGHARQVMEEYLKPENKALFEYVKLDGSFEDSPEGRAIVPGHAIESMWFQMHQFEDLGMRKETLKAAQCVRWHMERGWDEAYGGLVLGLDFKGFAPYWKFADTKLWWPQTEAMYALLLCHAVTGERWCMEWYWRLHEVVFKHYPVRGYGEWRQRLDRRFEAMNEFVALPVKDPFHLPRALVMCVRILRKMGW